MYKLCAICNKYKKEFECPVSKYGLCDRCLIQWFRDKGMTLDYEEKVINHLKFEIKCKLINFHDFRNNFRKPFRIDN
jgi:hypothetical protein